MRPPIRGVAAGAAAIAMFVSACSDDDSSRPGGGVDLELVSSLEQFDSCAELKDWAQEELAPRVGAYGFEEPLPSFREDEMLVDEELPVGADVDADVAEAPGSSPDAADRMTAADDGATAAESGFAEHPDDRPEYSETNVQVEGIDEPDIVKTDGERILALANGELHLVSVDDSEVLDTIALPDDLYNGEMMLSGDRVVVFGTAGYELYGSAATAPVVADETVSPADDMAPGYGSGPGTGIAQVDIDGDDLVLTDTYALEGTYISARMIDDVVRLVLHSDGHDRIPFVVPGGMSPEAEAQAAQVNEMLVENAEPEDLLPSWARLDDNGEVLDEGALLSCDQAHAPQDFAGFGMVSVVTIDVSRGVADGISASGGAGVMADGGMVYSSHENLYVAAPEWTDWEALSEDEARDAARDHGTSLHRFDISDPTRAEYDMSGRVDGWLLNQFAMDEYDGHLRVATTTGDPWGSGDARSESHVFVLEPAADALVPVGSVSGLGKGETIHSVRFMGDIGYVVTFEQVDPLYTIDLSDPSAPQERGELKILGYSAYLHPVAEGWLLGVGQDADERGWTEGTQVSLFDVRDLDNPERVAQETLPGASSTAEWDHRAFLWWADQQLAAIPVSTYDWSGDDSFEGLVGFTVDVENQEISELGRISHPEEDDDWGHDIDLPEPLCIWEDDEPDQPCLDDIDIAEPIVPGSWTPPIMRSWVIGDEVWTLSGSGLAATDLATFEDTEFIAFPG